MRPLAVLSGASRRGPAEGYASKAHACGGGIHGLRAIHQDCAILAALQVREPPVLRRKTARRGAKLPVRGERNRDPGPAGLDVCRSANTTRRARDQERPARIPERVAMQLTGHKTRACSSATTSSAMGISGRRPRSSIRRAARRRSGAPLRRDAEPWANRPVSVRTAQWAQFRAQSTLRRGRAGVRGLD